ARPTVTTTVDARVTQDTQQALRDWGEFAATGDLREVKDSFWPDGLQYQKLESEAPRLLARHSGPPAYAFTLQSPFRIIDDGRDKILRGTVTLARPGSPTRRFRWDIYMRADPAMGGRWRLLTVAETKT
ncbi:MAG: hypothetical protein L0Y54_09395, partial [Sporichthyaceae bacterium]|nr:hypothetical protein [Sporichthyaceae bacterium]